MSAATPINRALNNALNEMNCAIEKLSRFPETDKDANSALRSSTAARVFLRAALEAAAPPDGTQVDIGQRAATSSPATVTTTPKRQTAGHPFFSCNLQKDKLFSVREGIPPADALGQASCFLESAQAITNNADDAVPEIIFWSRLSD